MSVRGENEERQGARIEREGQRGGTERGVVVKDLWMSAIFSSKNTAVLSVMED